MNYNLPIATGEILRVLERQEEMTKQEYDDLKLSSPHILDLLTLTHRPDIEDAKIGNDIIFRRRLRSDALRIQRNLGGYQCAEKDTCNSYKKDKCNLSLNNPLLKKTPMCFSMEDVAGREYLEMAIEAVRTGSVLVVVIPDSILL